MNQDLSERAPRFKGDSLLTPVYKWLHPSSCAANIPQMIIRPFQVDRKKKNLDNFLKFVLGQTPPCCFLMMEMWVCVFSCSKEPSWSRCCPLPSYPIPWAVSYGIVCMFTDRNALNLPYWNLNMHCLYGYRNRINAYALWLMTMKWLYFKISLAIRREVLDPSIQ